MRMAPLLSSVHGNVAMHGCALQVLRLEGQIRDAEDQLRQAAGSVFSALFPSLAFLASCFASSLVAGSCPCHKARWGRSLPRPGDLGGTRPHVTGDDGFCACEKAEVASGSKQAVLQDGQSQMSKYKAAKRFQQIFRIFLWLLCPGISQEHRLTGSMSESVIP